MADERSDAPSSSRSRRLFVVAAAVAISAAISMLIPFDVAEGDDRGSGACGAPIVWLSHPPADRLPRTKHDFHWPECDFQSRSRMMLALIVAGMAWLVAGVAGVKRPFPGRQQIVLTVGAVGFATTATILAVVFGIATVRNPHSDITNLWTSFLTIAGGISAAVYWVLVRFLVLGLRARPR
jgi:hypothetical protein